MRALLDVNVLLALFDSNHADHRSARGWLESNATHGWASCVLTQNGFIRIICQHRYPNAISVTRAVQLLRAATQAEHHQYWSCATSFLDPEAVEDRHILGSRQITDVYLLSLAVANGGRLVTFDQSIPRHAVPKARAEHLVILS